MKRYLLGIIFFVGLIGGDSQCSFALLNLDISNPTVVPAANVCQSASNVLIYSFTLTASATGFSGNNDNFTALTFTQTGSATFADGDIIQYHLWATATSVGSGGTLLNTSTTTSFSSFSATQSFHGTSGTTVTYFITADISASAVAGDNIIVSALASGDGTGDGTGAITTGSSATTITNDDGPMAGGKQTIQAAPSITTLPVSVCAGSITTLDATPSGGTWSSGSITVATIGSASGILTGGADPGAAPVSTSITYVLSPGCSTSAIVTVNPNPAAITGTLSVCQGATTVLSDATTGGTWSSSSGDISIGSSSGIASASVTTLTTPATVTITYMAATGCSVNATVTANPAPATISASTSFCAGTTITLTDAVTGGTWSNVITTVATVVSSTGVVTGVSAGTSTITYSLGAGCTAMAVVTVNPSPSVSISLPTQAVCNNAPTTAVNFSGSPVAGTVYNWTNSTASIGLALSGTGNIPSFTALNGGSSPVIATIIVTPMAGTCPGTHQTAMITVNPTPIVSSVSAQIVCNNSPTTAIDFSGSSVAGTVYNWTNSLTSIGLAGSGSGNISAFTAINSGGSSVVATINVTPVANGCPGIPQMITITVKPSPSVSISLPTQALCNNASTTAINFSGSVVAGTVYNWTNTTASIGLALSGSGNIPSFTALNGGGSPIIATITVTPTAGTCPGTHQTATITVNPTPTVSPVSGQTVCNNSPTVAIDFSGSAVAGTIYNWTNSLTSIGLGASGFGNISAFTAMNSGGSPVVATITVTPVANSCLGTPQTASITVNPTPSVSAVSSQAVCNNSLTTSIDFSGSAIAGTVYNWTNSLTSIGLGVSGSGNISAFTAMNSGSSPVVATISVTPVANSCPGTPKTAAITVNPTPSVSAVSSQAVCDNSLTNAVDFSGSEVAGTVYNWTNSLTSIGLGASGTGNISAFTAMNSGSNPVVATITVTPVANGCPGTPQTASITVNPTPSVSAVSNQTVCNDLQTAAIDFSGSAVTGTVYNWTNSLPSIGLAASGSGNISAFYPNDPTNSLIIATITVTPVANGCSGILQTATITVNPSPLPTFTSVPTVNACAGTSATYTAQAGETNYIWGVPGTAGKDYTIVSGSIGSTSNSVTLTWITAGGKMVTVTYTNSYGCTATDSAFAFDSITIYDLPPVPIITTTPPGTLCLNTMYQNFGANAPALGVSEAYDWTATSGMWAEDKPNNQNCLVNFTTQGIDTIRVTATITLTGCQSHATATVTVTVNTNSITQTDSVINFESSLICLQTGVTYLWGYDVTSTLFDDTLPSVSPYNNTSQNYYFDYSPDFTDTLFWVKTTDPVTGCFEKSYYYAPAKNKGFNTNTNNGGLGEMKVYPNPAGNYLNVLFDNIENNVTLNISDIMGREMMMLPVQNVLTSIDVSGLQPSVYFIECYLNGVKVADSKFIKN